MRKIWAFLTSLIRGLEYETPTQINWYHDGEEPE
jgi:hypothetical protein